MKPFAVLPFVVVAAQGIPARSAQLGIGALLGGDLHPKGKSTTDDWLLGVTSITDDWLFGVTSTTVSSPVSTATTTATAPEHTSSVLSSSTAGDTSVAPTETGTPSTTSDQLFKGSRTWKIVGISLIVITFVVGTIFTVVFFDHWWRFLRDLVLQKKRAPDVEEFVPDWEKQAWVTRLAQEDGYPSTQHPFPTRPLGLSAHYP